MACNPSKIKSALFREKKNIDDIVYERIHTSDKTALRLIPDGGVVARDSNQESVIYGEARQASLAYQGRDHDPQPLEPGDMSGRTLAGQSGIFPTNINQVDDNACHGFCTLPFGQGFRIRGYEDFSLDVKTQDHCVKELNKQGKSHILGFFRGMRDHFSMFGMQNFSDNLLNQVVLNGEANSTVLGANQFGVTEGGWQAPPNFRMSIHFLEDYRDHIRLVQKMKGLDVPENWKLVIEMPRNDWADAVKFHNIERNQMLGAGGQPLTSVEIKMLDDPESPLHKREFHDYGNIRCVFNEEPIRGFFRQIGASNWEFTRVYDWKNVAGEEGGLVIAPNHDYRNDRIQVDGSWHDMVTLALHIHPKSFQRFGFEKPIKPIGKSNAGVNYQVHVIDGANIDDNDLNDKFRLVARHEFRFKTMYPEFSGVIAYRHGRREGYEIPVVPRDYVPGTTEFSTPQNFPECDLIDEVTTKNCDACGEVPQSDGQCVAVGAAANGEVGLEPCANALTTYEGAPSVVTMTVRRTGELAKPGSVDYVVAQGGGNAVAATHFTAVGATTLNFAAGQEFAHFDVAIIGGSGNPAADVDFDVTLVTPVDVDLGCALTRVAINDIS